MSIEEIARTYADVARELGVKVAPVGLSYLGTIAMTPELATFLQRIAWETVLEYEQPSRTR
jgi:hypothetical protein